MTWEIAVGIFTIVGAFSAVMQTVLKVNKTLIGLDESVKQLKNLWKGSRRRTRTSAKGLPSTKYA